LALKNQLNFLETNTQVRNIAILAQIILTIPDGTEWIPILHQKMLQWSQTEEANNEDYRQSSGKLTEKKIATQAFKFYLQLLQKLQLTIQLNDAIQLTKYGAVFKKCTPNSSQLSYYHTPYQQLFWLFWLFKHDYDPLLVLLQILEKTTIPCKEITIRQQYAMSWQQHLLALEQMPYCSTYLKHQIDDQLQMAHNTNPQPTAFKHIVPNRLDWLRYLQLISKDKNGFCITPKGKQIISLCQQNKHTLPYDALVVLFIPQLTNLPIWKDLTSERKHQIWQANIKQYYYQMGYDKEGAGRVAANPCFLYLCLYGIANQQYIATIADWEQFLQQPLSIGNLTYTHRKAVHDNENYITIASNSL